jgi:hypothetical protein
MIKYLKIIINMIKIIINFKITKKMDITKYYLSVKLIKIIKVQLFSHKLITIIPKCKIIKLIINGSLLTL